jgi:LL-diaminopimelate aminotransferase
LSCAAANPDSHGYQSYNGIHSLRMAFVKWYKTYFKVGLDQENEILPLMGSKEGIMHVSMAFLNPGDDVLVPDPGYPTYQAISKLLGCNAIFYDLIEKNNWLPDLNGLEKLNLKRVKLMWINYPNMPTGASASNDFFRKILDFGKKHSILICNDNPYSFILNSDHKSILLDNDAKSIALELNSLSKSSNMAGWRVGMVAGHKNYIAQILKVKSNMDSGMFLPIQLAAIEALNVSDEWYANLNAVYIKRRRLVEEIMNLLGCYYDKTQTGMFVWGRIPSKYSNSEQMTDELLFEKSIFVTPGSVFGKNGKNYIRISLCCKEEILFKAMLRIREELDKN